MKSVFNDRWMRGVMLETPTLDKSVDCTRIVTMGSCFARNITRWLNYHHYTNQTMPWDILYNPFSIHNEVKRLYEPIDWRRSVYWERNRSICRDPSRTWFSATSMSALEVYNTKFDSKALKIIDNATVMLITYGLSEIWKSINGGIVLNNVPLGKAVRSFSSYFPAITEVVKIIRKTVDVIKGYVGGDIPIIFTLSPVPLKRTASNMSIREANNLSKSILLVAIREVCSTMEGVHYFPSYEIIQALNETDSVWQNDGRHVTAYAVNYVAHKFMHYCNITHKSTKRDSKFFVPYVNERGIIVGKLTVDGTYIRK